MVVFEVYTWEGTRRLALAVYSARLCLQLSDPKKFWRGMWLAFRQVTAPASPPTGADCSYHHCCITLYSCWTVFRRDQSVLQEDKRTGRGRPAVPTLVLQTSSATVETSCCCCCGYRTVSSGRWNSQIRKEATVAYWFYKSQFQCQGAVIWESINFWINQESGDKTSWISGDHPRIQVLPPIIGCLDFLSSC